MDFILDCLIHKKQQCLKCHYEKTCDGLSFQQRKNINCDIMELADYEKLIDDQLIALREKVDKVIREAARSITTKQTQLWNMIESDPRMEWKFHLKKIAIQASVESSVIQDGAKSKKQKQGTKSQTGNCSSSKSGNKVNNSQQKRRS